MLYAKHYEEHTEGHDGEPLMFDLSIIIVSWNARDYLVRALESIIATTRRHTYEIIVVDNASSDGSPEMVEARFPQVQLIRNGENLGFARGNNIGIVRARGRLVALVNSDVEVLEDCLDQLVETLDTRPRVGMAGPCVLNSDGSLQSSHWNFPSVRRGLARMLALDTLWRWMAKNGRGPDQLPDGIPVDVLSGCFIVLRREALEQAGLLDESFYIYGEDMDLCRRFHAAGWQVRCFPAARAIHAGGASSANAPVRFFLELQKANLHYWTKHHGRAGRVFFLASTFVHHLLRLVPGVILYLFLPSLRDPCSQRIRRSAACMKWILHPPKNGFVRWKNDKTKTGPCVPNTH